MWKRSNTTKINIYITMLYRFFFYNFIKAKEKWQEIGRIKPILQNSSSILTIDIPFPLLKKIVSNALVLSTIEKGSHLNIFKFYSLI